jgi:hypothetical protein
MIKRLLLASVLTLIAPFVARAAGGACPTAAQYINPANLGIAGPLVTLAALGVTSCYYVAATGSDSNDGLSEASGHPWQHAPYMPNCTATCATVQAALTTTSAFGFIFRGGDTWHEFTGSPQIGLPVNWPNGTGSQVNGWDWIKSGTASTPFYIGVDFGWFSGGAWVRPIITSDNPVNPTPGMQPTPGFPFYFNTVSDPIVLNGIVASCAFSQGALNNLTLDSVQYVTVDNFEFTGMCFDDTGKTHQYLQHAGPPPQSSELSNFYNLYMHGYTHKPLVQKGLINANASIASGGTGYTTSSVVAVNNGTLLAIVQITSVSGGVVTGFNVLYGGTGVGTGTDTTTTVSGTGSGFTLSVSAQANVVTDAGIMMQGCSNACTGNQIMYFIGDGSDSDDTIASSLGVDTSSAILAYSFFNHLGGTVILDNCHTAHDNVWQYINNSTDAVSHGDTYFCEGEFAGNNFYYNNIFRFIGTEYGIQLSAPGIWFNQTNAGFTDFIFNNVVHDVNACPNFFNTSNTGSSSSAQFLYNNTFQSMDSVPGNNCPVWTNINSVTPVTEANNHYITGTNTGTGCTVAFAKASLVNGGGACTDTFMTTAAANAAGYTSANDYSPISSSSPTVGAGANESGISGPFGAAFLQTTSLGCTESLVNIGFGTPTLVCPDIMPANRPTTGACPGLGCWNDGAFNFVSPTVALAPNPYTFATTALGSNSSDSPVTFTLTNNTGVTITGVTISFTGANPGDFTETTSCGTTLASSASCQIFLTFTPTATGSRTATLSVSDSDASSPQTSSLSGTAIPSVIKPSPANPVTFGVVVTDPSIPSTVKNEKHSENLSAYNFDHVVLVGFLHQDRARNTASASARQ